MKTQMLIGSLTLLALAGAAQAHVTLEQGEAQAGSSYKAVLRVGHGCEGSATTRITVSLPAGFLGGKPVPKAGWTLEARRAPLAKPYESHGRTISDATVEVSWTAQNEAAYLQDAWYDEFTVRGSLPEQAGPLWFKVRQNCVKGEWNWAEIPVEGISTQGLKAPAVLLKVLPAAKDLHQH